MRVVVESCKAPLDVVEGMMSHANVFSWTLARDFLRISEMDLTDEIRNKKIKRKTRWGYFSELRIFVCKKP